MKKNTTRMNATWVIAVIISIILLVPSVVSAQKEFVVYPQDYYQKATPDSSFKKYDFLIKTFNGEDRSGKKYCNIVIDDTRIDNPSLDKKITDTRFVVFYQKRVEIFDQMSESIATTPERGINFFTDTKFNSVEVEKVETFHTSCMSKDGMSSIVTIRVN